MLGRRMIVDPSQTPQATVLIATKNRKADLRKAIASAMRQTADIEVLVVDDASDDGTAEMVKSEFPQARVHTREASTGYVLNRNLGAELARAPFIISIDDDTTFPSPEIIAHTIGEFDNPVVGAIAMPLIHSTSPDEVIHRAPDHSDVWATHKFTGAAHALRRDVFLALGGFRAALVHFGEEDELCLRLLNAGYVTRMGSAAPSYHDLSPRRNRPRERYYAARNVVFWSWMNAPLGVVWQRILLQTVREVAYAAKYRMPWATARGVFAGYRDSFFAGHRRDPVSRQAWDLWRDLRSRGPQRLRDIQSRLPRLSTVPAQPAAVTG